MILLQYLQLFVQYNLRRSATNLALSSGNKISHDTLLRVLYGDWSGKKHLESITRPKKFRGGYLVIDDTGLDKPHSKKMEGSYYFYSSSKGGAS